jgi:indole-3-glycerol phosphate synthase
LELLSKVPSCHRVVSESGIRNRATVRRLEASGVAAFLVGESLMREPDIGTKLDQLRGVGPVS